MVITQHADEREAPVAGTSHTDKDPAPAPARIVVPDFESLYAREPDPWQVRSSFYEQRKLDVLLATLGRPFYGSAWDPACGVGELALRLSARCTTVLATDLAASAVELTRHRCAGESAITVAQLTLPAAPEPPQTFDLVVLSEFLYYLDADDRAAALDLVDTLTSSDAEIVSVHWRHHPHDAWLSGVDTEAEIAGHLSAHGWSQTVSHHDEQFVLDSFRRGGLT